MTASTPGKGTLLSAVAAALYLTARLFVGAGVPIILGSDQAFFWTYGSRILHGELPYRDFFQFTPPGVDLLFAASFAAFGPRFVVTNAIVVVLGAALGGVCFRVARGLMEAAWAALAAAVFVVFAFGLALGATHHWWSVLFVMLAVASLGDGARRTRYLVAGGFLAIATFCTQTHGLAGLVGCLVFAFARSRRHGLTPREAWLRAALLALGFAVKLAALWIYFLLNVGLGVIVACVVTYVWRDMGPTAPGWGLGLPDPLTAESVRWLAPYLVVYALVPVGLGLGLAASWTRRLSVPTERDDRALLLGVVGVTLAVEVSMSLSWIRVLAAAMPGIILATLALARTPRHRELAWRGASLVVACVALLFVRSTQRHHTVVLDLPAGRGATEPGKSDELAWLAENVPPGSALFAGDRPNLYLPLALHNPLYLDAAVPSRQTTAAMIERATRDLERLNVPYVVWSDVLDPEERPGDGLDAVRALRAYVHEHYRMVRAFPGGDSLWVRRG